MLIDALVVGFLAASSLLLGSLIALLRPFKTRTIGLVMAFGAGALISSVAYELVEEAYHVGAGDPGVGVAFLAGALASYFGDVLIERLGGPIVKAHAVNKVARPSGSC